MWSIRRTHFGRRMSFRCCCWCYYFGTQPWANYIVISIRRCTSCRLWKTSRDGSFMKRIVQMEWRIIMGRTEEKHFIGEYFYGGCIKLCKEHPHNSIHHQSAQSYSHVPCVVAIVCAILFNGHAYGPTNDDWMDERTNEWLAGWLAGRDPLRGSRRSSTSGLVKIEN